MADSVLTILAILVFTVALPVVLLSVRDRVLNVRRRRSLLRPLGKREDSGDP